MRGEAGEHIASNPPYGYIKDPQNKKKWIVDEDAAKIVRRIFDLCIAGKDPMQIAKILTAEKVLTVTAYNAKQKGWTKPAERQSWHKSAKLCPAHRNAQKIWIRSSSGFMRIRFSEKREIEDEAGQVADVGCFLQLAEKYSDLQELDAAMVNELIDKIVIHNPVKINEKKHVTIEVYFTYVGKAVSRSKNRHHF